MFCALGSLLLAAVTSVGKISTYQQAAPPPPPKAHVVYVERRRQSKMKKHVYMHMLGSFVVANGQG